MRFRLIGAVVAVSMVMASCDEPTPGPSPRTSPQSVSADAGAALANAVDPAEVRAIAKEAYVYGFPMVDLYRIQYSYFVDAKSSQYKGKWNELHNSALVFTPDDTAVQTPNSDTPYSQAGADLRTEPLVLTVPPIEQKRYYSASFVDSYTYDYDLIGSRTTGNGGGKYLLVGPKWKGEKPAGIDKVIHSETDFTHILIRTQLFEPGDIENVRKVRSGYGIEPLSKFEKKPAPAPAPAIDFPAPLTPDQQKTSPDFFRVLAFALSHAPVVPSESALRAKFARIGIRGDTAFNPAALTPTVRAAFVAGMQDAQQELAAFVKNDLTTGKVGSQKLFGTPEEMKGNYLYRYAGAALGILGLPGEEATYVSSRVDQNGVPPTSADGNRYTLTFPAGQLPPVNSFWSVTMYKLPESPLVENPLKRYLINSPMLDELKRNPDGSLTLCIQNASPGADRESNWLPAPAGPFNAIFRMY